MTTSRWIDKAPFDPPPGKKPPVGPNGRLLCRWCGTEVQGRRVSWCSDQCVDEYLIRKSSSRVRQLVNKRDRGICSSCGLDTEELARSIEDRFLFFKSTSLKSLAEMRTRIGLVGSRMSARGYSLWEADHIVPVVEGGGACGLENYRTLCCWCHKIATAELAKRRSKAGASVQLFDQPIDPIEDLRLPAWLREWLKWSRIERQYKEVAA